MADGRIRTGREPSRPLFYFAMPRSAHEGARSIGLFLLLLLAIDAVVIGAVLAPGLAQGGGAAPAPAAGDAAAKVDDPPLTPEERGWALCQTRFSDQDVTPGTIAITYLDPSLDEALTADEVRNWFGDLPPKAVEVYKLEDKAGRRRLSFEITRRNWPDWEAVVGDATGERVCARLRTALRAKGIGRPGLKPNDTEASRYDFEFLHARRVDRYRTIQLVGSLERALKRFDDLQAWLAETP